MNKIESYITTLACKWISKCVARDGDACFEALDVLLRGLHKAFEARERVEGMEGENFKTHSVTITHYSDEDGEPMIVEEFGSFDDDTYHLNGF